MTVYNLSGNQTITNFNPATDIIQEGSQSISASQLAVSGTAAGTVITDSAGNVLTLSGITNAQLTNANFNIVNGSIIDVGANNTTAALNTLSNAHTLSGTGSDQVLELGGNDTIVDATTLGGNFIRGGSGNDNISITSSTSTGDTIVAGAGADVINAATSTGPATIWGANNAAYTGTAGAAGGADTITGALGGGLIHGSTGNSSITEDSNTGNVTIIAGHGNDTIAVDAASNTSNLYEGGKGTDNITDTGTYGHNTFAAGLLGAVGSAGNGFALTGGSGSDNVFYGDGGNGSINAGTGVNDTVYGGAGAVSITSHSQTSSITGSLFELQKGNDTFTSTAATSFDTVEGGSGTDSISLIAATGVRQVDILVGSGITTVNDTTESAGSAASTVNVVTDVASGSGIDTYNIQLTTAANSDFFNLTGGLKATDVVNVTLQGLDSNAVTILNDTGGVLELRDGIATHGVLDITGLTLAGTIDVTGTSGASYIHYNETGTGTILGAASDTTNDLLIGGTGDDTIYTGTGTVQVITGTGTDLVNDDGVSVTDTITGGGSADSIDFTGASMTVANLGSGGVTGFIDYKFTGTGTATATIAATLATTSIPASDTVTIDGSALSGALHITSFGGDDGVKLDILGGTGVDTINLASDTGTEGGTITGGSGTADQLIAGAGNWSIAVGAGTDTVTGGAGQDTISLSNETGASTILFTNSDGGSNYDSISGFNHTYTDVFSINHTNLDAASALGLDPAHATSIQLLGAVATAVTTGAGVIDQFSGAASASATGNINVLIGADFTQSSALTAIEASGSRAITMNATTIAQYSSFELAYTDGTNTYVDAVEVTTAPGATTFASGDLTSHHLAILSGYTTPSALAAADFVFA